MIIHDKDCFLLDLDGTLLDLKFDHKFWFEHVVLCFSQKEKIEFEDAKNTLSELYKNERGTLKWYCTDYWSEKLGLDLKRITETYMNDIQDFEGTHTFLANLQSMKKTTIIVSNAHRDTINIKLTKTKLWGYFDDVISSHDYGYPKEDINFWINLEKNLLFEKTKSVLIDDNIDSLKRAFEFGIKDIIGITKPDSTRANLIINDFPTVSNISELIIN